MNYAWNLRFGSRFRTVGHGVIFPSLCNLVATSGAPSCARTRECHTTGSLYTRKNGGPESQQGTGVFVLDLMVVWKYVLNKSLLNQIVYFYFNYSRLRRPILFSHAQPVIVMLSYVGDVIKSKDIVGKYVMRGKDGMQ